jgi:starch synthase (maltosyl-transferring)
VRIFRVDNPHTKPLAFWEWAIGEVRSEHPDVIFLAEAFTNPPMMAALAEIGFTQSYTYFTWRYSRQELTEYLTQLSTPPLVDTMRPNVWPNTPDILEGVLRDGPLAAFALRFVLAATLVPNYGIYSGYELGENRPASPDNTEYLDSEKYQVRRRDFAAAPNLDDLIGRVNRSRRAHRALQRLASLRFHGSDNEAIIAYSKVSPDGQDVVLVVVNLDPDWAQAATLSLDLGALGLPWDEPLEAHDELTDTTFPWHGPNPWVRLDPAFQPAHLLHLRRR